jgi:hypothetical protein
MTVEQFPRRAQLLVVSTRHTARELEDRLAMQPDAAVEASGPSDVSRRGRHDESTWELHEEGTSDADVTELLESLHTRALPITGSLKVLNEEGCTIILRLILRFSPADAHGAGFAVTRPLIKWLNDAGIEFIDVDQYIFQS